MIDSFKSLKFSQADIEAGNVDENLIKETLKKLSDKCLLEGKDSKLVKMLSDLGVFSESPETLGNKVYKDVVKTFKGYVNDHFKGTNQITKILIGVCITLPITCTALNWVYPRFMEIFFPGLAGTKKSSTQQVEQNGGNK